MKDNNEFSRFAGASANATVLATADGKFTFDDLFGYIRPGSLATDGIKGFGNIGSEYYDATPAERDQDDAVFDSELTAVDDNKRDLAIRAQSGMKAVYALIVGTAEENAAAKLAAYLSGPTAASNPTAAELLEVIRGRVE